MKHLTLIVIVSLLINQKAQAQCADSTNIYSFSYDGKDYELVMEMQNWENAAACAVERGGYLAEINSEDEQNAMYDAIVNGAAVASNYTIVNDGGGIAYIWIGATDKDAEGTWLWDGNNDTVGDNFWIGQGNAGAGGGSAVGSAYVNWGGTSTGTQHEPDDYSGQDAAAIGLAGWPSGTTMLGIPSEWNDIDISNSLYYLIEYDNSSSVIDPNQKELYIYPNPVEDCLVVDGTFSQGQISEISIFNSLGEIIMRNKHLNGTFHKFELTTVPPGIYFTQIAFEDGTSLNQKIVLK